MNTKKTLGMLFAVLLLSGCVSEDDSYTQGVWVRKSDLDGPSRSYACSFTIGNSGYLFGGYGSKTSLNDLWRYDIEGNYWEKCATASIATPSARHWAISFALNGKGYITTGTVKNTVTYLKDTWEYDPSTDQWKQMDDFPGTGRVGALGFALNGYGYVGCGRDENKNYLKDLYRFNPTAPSGSQWQIISGYSGTKRVFATTWVYNNEAYICGGSNNGTNADDFWKFDGTTWTQLRDISDSDDEEYDDEYKNIVRSMAAALIIDDRIYWVGGNASEESGTNYSDYWIYDPATDLWSNEGDYLHTPFAGSTRTGTSWFSNGTRGFIVAGLNGSNPCDDMWELLPYELED